MKMATQQGMTGYNTKSMICGFLKNYDACQVSFWQFKNFLLLRFVFFKKGDSGGPLFVENEPNRYQIIG